MKRELGAVSSLFLLGFISIKLLKYSPSIHFAAVQNYHVILVLFFQNENLNNSDL